MQVEVGDALEHRRVGLVLLVVKVGAAGVCAGQPAASPDAVAGETAEIRCRGLLGADAGPKRHRPGHLQRDVLSQPQLGCICASDAEHERGRRNPGEDFHRYELGPFSIAARLGSSRRRSPACR